MAKHQLSGDEIAALDALADHSLTAGARAAYEAHCGRQAQHATALSAAETDAEARAKERAALVWLWRDNLGEKMRQSG